MGTKCPSGQLLNYLVQLQTVGVEISSTSPKETVEESSTCMYYLFTIQIAPPITNEFQTLTRFLEGIRKASRHRTQIIST